MHLSVEQPICHSVSKVGLAEQSIDGDDLQNKGIRAKIEGKRIEQDMCS